MLNKPFMATVMVGMGLLLAYMPRVWKLVAYSIPAISVCLLVACIVKFFRMFGSTDES